MLRQLFDLRTALALIAIAIVTGTIFYSGYLSKEIALKERDNISQWVEANKFIASAPADADLTLASKIQQKNDDIPVIWTDGKDSIIDSKNILLPKEAPKEFLKNKLQDFKTAHDPITLVLRENPYEADKYYYGDSKLLKQIRYFPIVQLLIVALFIFITFYSMSVRNTSTQNRVWAGMAKETAHQLGTPISSLQGWVEMLKEQQIKPEVWQEMEKDVERLKLISDRFGKIGSIPKLEEENLTIQVENIVDYIKRMAPDKVKFIIESDENVVAKISPPLFDWVIENLLKNALDAMSGSGLIKILIIQQPEQAVIEISDSGKGISNQNIKKVFKPGFTTKKRGWGLGLSLCKRIIEQYHGGLLTIKNTELNKGTTFRIILNT
ncbi:MAG: HAMP domain-containing sensor histidine kinase [Ginsengibacter sp.]